MAAREDQLIQSRLDKLQKIQQAGIEPYPATTTRAETIEQARIKQAGETVSIAGRLTSWRAHGGSTFADLRDLTGEIQLFFKKDTLGEEQYSFLKNIDTGDFVSAQGTLFTTQAGELTIDVQKFELLTKSIRPLPSEYYGVKDIETRLRKRYLDLIFHPDVKQTFIKKSMFWQSVRQYLLDKTFIEVETPALELIPGGAEARPFITHHNALDIDLYLRISLELYQKRLLVGGFEKIFEIGRIFRNEGIDAEHLQDYTQMEFYWAYANYEDLMAMTEDMFKTVIQKTFGTTVITSHGKTVDWGQPWKRLDYFDAFKEANGIDLSTTSVEELTTKAQELKLKLEPNIGKGRLIDLIYKKTVRPFVIEPTHLIHHPVEVSPLAKRHPENPAKVQRVQTLAYGSELTNGYSELNDPVDQRQRFEDQVKLRTAGDEEAQMMDEDFVEALEYGMPPAAGFGMSERVFAFLVDMPLREAVFFPTLRPEKTSTAPVLTSAKPIKVDDSTNLDDLPIPEFVPTDTSSAKPRSADDFMAPRHNEEGFMTIADAEKMVLDLLQNKNLQNHSWAAGAAMAALYDQLEVEAEHEGTTRDDWIITGMLHDVDYEVTNKELERHTEVATEKLSEFIAARSESKDQVERIIKAVRGHCDKAARDTLMAKAIYACDELTGLIVAAALIRPDKQLEGLTVDSVLKRFKESGFAKGANRDQIATCDAELGLNLDLFTEIVLDAMKIIHERIGL